MMLSVAGLCTMLQFRKASRQYLAVQWTLELQGEGWRAWTKSSKNALGSRYWGSLPNRAIRSQARSTAHDSV